VSSDGVPEEDDEADLAMGGTVTEDPATEDPATEDPATKDPATKDPATEDPRKYASMSQRVNLPHNWLNEAVESLSGMTDRAMVKDYLSRLIKKSETLSGS